LNKREYLLITLMEEASEVIKVASKMLRFGDDNFHPTSGEGTNREKLQDELNDVFGVVALLQDENIIDEKTLQGSKIYAKKAKVLKYFEEQNDNYVERIFDGNNSLQLEKY